MKLIKTNILLLGLFIIHGYTLAQNYDKWAFTDYIYLAKPSYIFKVESEVTHLGGQADNSLQGLIYKVHEKSFTTPTIHYYFEVEEVVYGEEKSTFHLSFSAEELSNECDLINDFNNHNDETFWKGHGRSLDVNFPVTHSVFSCFEMGQTYLIIGNNRLKCKGYEIVNSAADKWLEFVRNKVPEIQKLKLENKEWLEALCKEKTDSSKCEDNEEL